jgi:hypothetical protein
LQQPTLLSRNISGETAAIALICLLDLLTTLYWVSQGQAKEGNPVMAYFLNIGPGAFIIAKIVMFAPALVAAEWYRQYRPVFVTRLLRWVIAGYLFLYIAGVGAHYGRALDYYRHLLFG